MRYIDKHVVHCAATPPSMDIGVDEIRQWHTVGNGWSDIGYHFVIRRDGTIELGRPIERAGAHAKGHNANSVGTCLVGGVDEDMFPEDNFTKEQKASLRAIDTGIKAFVDNEVETLGHRDLPGVTKDCPCFDVKKWLNKE